MLPRGVRLQIHTLLIRSQGFIPDSLEKSENKGLVHYEECNVTLIEIRGDLPI